MTEKKPQDFNTTPRYRLAEIEQILRKHQVVGEKPSRQTLIEMCEDGTFDGKLTRFGWVVTQKSFWDWVKGLEGED